MSLADDPRVRDLLADGGPFHGLEHHERVGSTNDVARARLSDGAAPGLVVVADRQTAGRGRGGRSWTDDLEGPEGPANLAVTATIAAPSDHVELSSLAAGLAVAKAFEALGADAGLKWPNDVVLAGRKAAGILVERHELVGRDVLLIGCGLDLDWRGVRRADEAAGWTSLAESIGGPVDRGAVLSGLLAALGEQFDDLTHEPGRLLEAYRRRCVTLGAEVDVILPRGTPLNGTAVAIDERGRLVVETGHERVAVLAGEVTHLRPVAPT